MSKKLPHGMTANMMAIAKVEALGRQMGGHYSAGSVTDEARALVAKAKKKKAPCICEECGNEIKIAPGGHKRKYCDKCLEEKRTVAQRENARKRNSMDGVGTLDYEIKYDDDGVKWYVLKCRKCGNQTKKLRYTQQPICAECKRLRIRELERKRWHEKKAERARLRKEKQDGET